MVLAGSEVASVSSELIEELLTSALSLILLVMLADSEFIVESSELLDSLVTDDSVEIMELLLASDGLTDEVLVLPIM